MGRKASEYVKEYLRRVRGRLTERNRDERALFVGKRGRRIHPLIVERLIRAYARAAGVAKRTTPHTLRHTCGTHLLAGGADVAHVQRLLGPARIATTQIYTRVARPDLKRTHARTHPASSWKDYAGTSPRAVRET
jgi:integrase/recombinase XerD